MISGHKKNHDKIIPVAIWLGGVLAIVMVAVLVFSWGKAARFVSQMPSSSKPGGEAVIETGSVVVIRASYNNPGEENIAIKIEEAIPEGVDYVKGTAAIDGRLVTDAKDADQGYYDQTADTFVWEAGSVPPGAGGNVSYEARVTGAKTEMKSTTKFILDPGTEDEEELAGEPFIFSLGKPFPR